MQIALGQIMTSLQNFVAFCSSSSQVGRPPVNVDTFTVLQLRAINYSWSKIASLIGVSRSTLYRKLDEAGISTSDRTMLSPGELESLQISKKSIPMTVKFL